MDNIVITVARGFGSGGKEIASKVAKDLGISCYENRILTLASQLSGLDEELFNEVNERVREKGGFAAFMKGLPRARNYITKGKFVSDDTLFEYQKKIIEELAATQSCVIVGKCADWILRGRDNVISLYIEAPRDFCLKRTMEHMQLLQKETLFRPINIVLITTNITQRATIGQIQSTMTLLLTAKRLA